MQQSYIQSGVELSAVLYRVKSDFVLFIQSEVRLCAVLFRVNTLCCVKHSGVRLCSVLHTDWSQTLCCVIQKVESDSVLCFTLYRVKSVSVPCHTELSLSCVLQSSFQLQIHPH